MARACRADRGLRQFAEDSTSVRPGLLMRLTGRGKSPPGPFRGPRAFGYEVSRAATIASVRSSRLFFRCLPSLLVAATGGCSAGGYTTTYLQRVEEYRQLDARLTNPPAAAPADAQPVDGQPVDGQPAGEAAPQKPDDPIARLYDRLQGGGADPAAAGEPAAAPAAPPGPPAGQ